MRWVSLLPTYWKLAMHSSKVSKRRECMFFVHACRRTLGSVFFRRKTKQISSSRVSTSSNELAGRGVDSSRFGIASRSKQSITQLAMGR